jgi:hypothetical protein
MRKGKEEGSRRRRRRTGLGLGGRSIGWREAGGGGECGRSGRWKKLEVEGEFCNGPLLSDLLWLVCPLCPV